ncbi:hypothetical protein CDL12_03994 [Handroanthus impetiginosus]|uniref:Uncharacterized protein n=1 Tax=Handroanthus impetiginosus TaxID=429701 RepID=A0A2G9I0J3_9LAMI|nr:hypothetical protein CDL12_03994 [Handroanthus impetiginosus]
MAAVQDLEANIQETVEKGKEIRTMEFIAMKYLSFYFICQGLVLVGVIGGSSSSSLKCHEFWLVFTLSFSLAMAYLIQLLENAWRYKETLRATIQGRDVMQNAENVGNSFYGIIVDCFCHFHCCNLSVN